LQCYEYLLLLKEPLNKSSERAELELRSGYVRVVH
jgi:hypothetical protein